MSILKLSVRSVAMLRTLTQSKAALPHPSPLPWGEGETPKGEELTLRVLTDNGKLLSAGWKRSIVRAL